MVEGHKECDRSNRLEFASELSHPLRATDFLAAMVALITDHDLPALQPLVESRV